MVLIKDSNIGLNLEPSNELLLYQIDFQTPIQVYAVKNVNASVRIIVLNRFYTNDISVKHKYDKINNYNVTLDLHGIRSDNWKFQIVEKTKTTTTTEETGEVTTEETTEETTGGTTKTTTLLNSTEELNENIDIMKLGNFILII